MTINDTKIFKTVIQDEIGREMSRAFEKYQQECKNMISSQYATNTRTYNTMFTDDWGKWREYYNNDYTITPNITPTPWTPPPGPYDTPAGTPVTSPNPFTDFLRFQEQAVERALAEMTSKYAEMTSKYEDEKQKLLKMENKQARIRKKMREFMNILVPNEADRNRDPENLNDIFEIMRDKNQMLYWETMVEIGNVKERALARRIIKAIKREKDIIEIRKRSRTPEEVEIDNILDSVIPD